MLILGWGMVDSPMLDDFEYLYSNENGGNFEIVFSTRRQNTRTTLCKPELCLLRQNIQPTTQAKGSIQVCFKCDDGPPLVLTIQVDR